MLSALKFLRIFSYSLKFSSPNNFLSHRCLTSKQAAVALRPFYLIVHPDRFGRDPQIRSNNEKSLKVFNGYLNDVFHCSLSQALIPVKVNFVIRRKNSEEMENVSIQLSGADPSKIVRLALEQCKLSADHLPKSIVPFPKNPVNNPPKIPVDSWGSADDLWNKLNQENLLKRKRSSNRFSSNDLLACLLNQRDNALTKMDNFKKTKELLNDEIDYIIRKIGVKEIVWSINWDHSYMRRCLTNIKDMFSQVDHELKQAMVFALYNRTLILGRGSFVCCDGSLQFGADDATGAWQKVCLEANVRRFEVNNLRRLVLRVCELLGGAQMVVNQRASLLSTTDYMQTLIVRISSRPLFFQKHIAELGANAIIEVVSAYDELAILSDGRLRIPCNVDADSLNTFLKVNGKKSRSVNVSMKEKQLRTMELCKLCKNVLKLNSLTWESSLNLTLVIECLERLSQANESIRNNTKGLSLHLSTNSNFHVCADGKVAIPINWI